MTGPQGIPQGLVVPKADTGQQATNVPSGLFIRRPIDPAFNIARDSINNAITTNVTRHIQDPNYIYNATPSDDNLFYSLADQEEAKTLDNILLGAGDTEALVRLSFNQPLVVGKALLTGTLDMLKLPINLALPGTPLKYSEGAEEDEVIKNFITMSASIAGAGVGAVAGAPLGMSVPGALIGSSIAASASENMLRDTPFLRALTADAGITALTLGFGAAAKGTIHYGRIRGQLAALNALSEKKGETIWNLVSQGDPELAKFSAGVIAKALESEGKRFRTIADIDNKGYIIKTTHNGAYTIYSESPTTGKKLVQHPLKTVKTVDEVEAFLKDLPRRDGWKAGVDGLYAPFHDEIKPGFISRILQQFNDFSSTKFPGIYVSNMLDRLEALERSIAGLIKSDRNIYLQFDGTPPSLVAERFLPLQRAVSAFHNVYKQALKQYVDIGKDLQLALAPYHWREHPAIRERIGKLANQFITDERLKFLTPAERRYADDILAAIKQWDIDPNLKRIFKYLEEAYDEVARATRHIDQTKHPQAWDAAANSARAAAAVKSNITDPERQVAKLIEAINLFDRKDLDVTRVLDLVQRELYDMGDATQYMKSLNMTGPEIAVARRYANELRDMGWGYFGGLNNFYAGQVYGRFGAVVGNTFIDPDKTAKANINKMIRSDAVAMLDHSFDPERNLLRLSETMLWNENVGTLWHDTLQDYRSIFKKAGLAREGLAVSQVFESLHAMRGRHLDDGLDRAAMIGAFEGTGADVTWRKHMGSFLDGVQVLLSTGLLGYRPKLGVRDIIDANAIYGIYLNNPVEALGLFGKEYAELVRHGSFENWLKATADNDLSAAKLLEDGHISRYENFEYLKKIAKESKSPQGRALSNMMEKYAELGERSSLQPQVFVINQAVIWRNEYQKALKALKPYKGKSLDQQERLKLLAETRALFQSDETIKVLDDLLSRGKHDDFARGLADAVNLSLMGRFGLGFGPPTGGRVMRLLFNFRTFAATRKQSIMKMLTRGSKKQRALAFTFLGVNEGMWRAIGPKLGLRPLYMSQIAGIGYTGGPLWDLGTDFITDMQLMDEYTDIEEPLVNATWQFLKMMYPEKAYNDVAPWF